MWHFLVRLSRIGLWEESQGSCLSLCSCPRGCCHCFAATCSKKLGDSLHESACSKALNLLLGKTEGCGFFQSECLGKVQVWWNSKKVQDWLCSLIVCLIREIYPVPLDCGHCAWCGYPLKTRKNQNKTMGLKRQWRRTLLLFPKSVGKSDL